MWQRIQTIYLLLVVIVSGVLSTFLVLYTEDSGAIITVHNTPLFAAFFGAGSFLALITIFLYKKRGVQMKLNRLNIIIHFILLGVFVYRSLNMSGGSALSEKGIGMFLPIISIVLLVLSNQGIGKDEQLVKSADRLR